MVEIGFIGFSAVEQFQPDVYYHRMTLREVEQEALKLDDKERAELVLSLMRTLSSPGSEVGEEEVLRRDSELESGSAQPILHEEFVRRVEKDRER